MPVSVSLIDLVSVPGTRPLWPAEFNSFITAMEGNDRTAWGAAADWLQENGEEELEAAFRFVFKRDKIAYRIWNGSWAFDGLPATVRDIPYRGRSDSQTLAGAAALLARKLKIAREELA